MSSAPVAPADSSVVLRPLTADDRDDLVRHANDHQVWSNLTHIFPHPYTNDDFDDFLASLDKQDPLTNFAITVDDQCVGMIGADFGTGIYDRTATFGYWIGADTWGRGIATEAASQMIEWLRTAHNIRRISAHVFAWNPASARVLEKCGFRLEGRLIDAVCKDGLLVDGLLYGLVFRD